MLKAGAECVCVAQTRIESAGMPVLRGDALANVVGDANPDREQRRRRRSRPCLRRRSARALARRGRHARRCCGRRDCRNRASRGRPVDRVSRVRRRRRGDSFQFGRGEFGGSGSHFGGCGDDVVDVAIVAEQAFVRDRDDRVLEQAFGDGAIDRVVVGIGAREFAGFAIGGGLAREQRGSIDRDRWRRRMECLRREVRGRIDCATGRARIRRREKQMRR